MLTYHPPVQEYQFLLHELYNVSTQEITGYDQLDKAFTQAALEEAGKIAQELFFPLNSVGDAQGCTLQNGEVKTPKGFKNAFDQMRAGGWTGLDFPEQYGGQNMPCLMNTIVGEMFSAANQSLAMYSGLTHGAAATILAHGTDQQKTTYLPPMIACDWTGTMNLTEPQCGTDLGLIRTKAEPQANGSYRISGQKIYISSGEHDLAKNIIHLVLARIPGGPEGVKGISLFIVPKFLPNENGQIGARNAVECLKIENKMGIHGNATCVMTYEGATGYLLGHKHDGMRAMFTMMNEARLGVGMQGVAQADAAYQSAATYAKERLQGRDVVRAQNPDGPADALIVHPDVRRTLMDQKSFIEGARAFLVWGALLLDQANRNKDKNAQALISLLTPVLKGFLTDRGFDMTVKAQQIYGGHGYINDTGISQYMRDARITMIYEGANAVQALDLVGRKLPQNGGKAMLLLLKTLDGFCKAQADNDAMGEFITPLQKALENVQSALGFFMEHGLKNPHQALAGSYDFMHLLGHVCMGFTWARMALSAQKALKKGGQEAAFYETKIITARYYMQRQMPKTDMHLSRIQSGADMVMALDAEFF